MFRARIFFIFIVYEVTICKPLSSSNKLLQRLGHFVPNIPYRGFALEPYL